MPLANRLRNFVRKQPLEREVDEELAFHVSMRRDEYRKQGLSPQEAEAQARRDFGRQTSIREETRSMNLFLWLETLVQDLRFGARQLIRNRTLTLTSILTLALGMGATTAIFTLADATLFRPLAYPGADRIVAIHDRFPTGLASPTIPEFLDYQAANQSFEQMTFFDSRDYQITGSDEPQRAFSARVTASFFPLLGARPILGRVFEEAEIANGTSDAVVLSNSFWQRAFGADPGVIGRRLDVNGVPGTVIGVLQPGFSLDYATMSFFEPVEMYLPFPMTPIYLSRTGPDAARRRVQVLARLRSDASLESATANLSSVAARLRQDYPELYRGRNGELLSFNVYIRPLRDALLGGDRTAINLLSGAVAIILLLACVNTMQARLAHGLTRHREFAVRGAIGAGRGRLIRQLLAESVLLAFAAAVAGVFVAQAGLSLLLTLLPPNPMLSGLGLNFRAFAFMGGLLLVASMLCGLLPAFSASRAGSSLMLRSASVSDGSGHHRIRGLLMTAQIGLALVLLISAGLLVRTMVAIQSNVGGFSADNVVTMQMRMRFQRTKGMAHPSLAWREIVEHVERSPGIAAAAIATGLPPGGGEFPFTAGENAPRQVARVLFVSPGYFTTLQIPVIAGRAFSEQDTPERPPVIVISEDLARQLWPGENAVGRILTSGALQYTVAGVVGNVRFRGFQSTMAPQVYLSYRTTTEPNMLMAVRTQPGIADALPVIREGVRAADPDQPFFRVRTMDQFLYESNAGPRMLAVLSGVFAFLGLALASVGLYGAVAYLVERRIPEFAIRFALGASGWDVLKLLSARLLLWSGIGLGLGVAGSRAVSGILQGFMNGGIQSTDPITYAGAAAVFLAVVALAASIPLRRAVSTDPASALRTE